VIGKICKAWTPFYNAKIQKMGYKGRPALVIARADAGDYVILPVSTITHKENIDPEFDVRIEPKDYPKLHLERVSYVRTHKQIIANRASLNGAIGDLKTEYEDLYLEILEKREKFSKNITEQAIE